MKKKAEKRQKKREEIKALNANHYKKPLDEDELNFKDSDRESLLSYFDQ
jgi:hypothetical protein